MRKEYCLTIKFSVNVNEKVKGEGDPKLIGYLQQLLTAFIKHKTLIFKHIKYFFLDLIINGDFFAELFDMVKAKPMHEIVADEKIKKELTPDANEFVQAIHFEGATHFKDEISEIYREMFGEQFEMPSIKFAEFKEIEDENKKSPKRISKK